MCRYLAGLSSLAAILISLCIVNRSLFYLAVAETGISTDG